MTIEPEKLAATIDTLRELEKCERTASLDLARDVEASADALVSYMRLGNGDLARTVLARISELVERWSRLDPDALARALDRAVREVEVER